MSRPVILTACDYFLPGYKAGGPIRTITGIVDQLGDEFLFRVVTRDRDLGERAPYTSVAVGEWRGIGRAEVMYLSPSRLGPIGIRRFISSVAHSVLYLNSCFSFPFGIAPLLLRRAHLVPRLPVIVAPRGELAPSALAINPERKRLYLAALKSSGLADGVIWQASGPHEEEDIRRVVGGGPRVMIAPDLVARAWAGEFPELVKTSGVLRVLFLSRISRIKNLDWGLNLLRSVPGRLELSIYGPVEDNEYWSRCQRIISQLPSNIEVKYGGLAAPTQVRQLMAHHHLLFLPTLGENFGHAIIESLAAGCPVLISDQTPWRDLEPAGAGWDIPLDKPDRFRRVLTSCINMDGGAWQTLSTGARAYADRWLQNPLPRIQNETLFRAAING